MEMAVLVAAGFLVAFVIAAMPGMRERYGKKYEDEGAFLRERQPDAWGLLEAGSVADETANEDALADRCPLCETANDTGYTYCRRCGTRLPVREPGG